MSSLGRATLRAAGLALLAATWPDAARAEVAGARMASAPAGIIESGVPSFVVLGPEAMGLSAPPTDFHLLADGRLLLVSRREIAFGDGVRWEAFAPAADQPPMPAQVAVDADGAIYAGIENGIAQVAFGDDGHWRLRGVAQLPDDPGLRGKTVFAVSDSGGNWFWHGGSGVIVTWKPGAQPQVVGSVSSIERIFAVAGATFVSEQSSGGLFELSRVTATATSLTAADRLASETVTSVAPFAPGVALVGTSFAGLKLFDGASFRSFPSPPLLQGHRISDVCAVGTDSFAAAVDTVGVVFFDRKGQLLQVLDRSPDHRLARARRLLYAPNGVLWVLLNDGLARIEFPSPVSHFEPLLVSGLTYAKPLRHEGELWMLTDGRAMQAVYDASHRLERFEDRSPPGRYLFSLVEVEGRLVATNDAGIHVREHGTWRLALPGIVNARVGIGRRRAAGIPYVARGEFGFLQPTDGGYAATRIPAAQLSDSYNAAEDAAGIIWLELGTSLVGRLDATPTHPTLELLGTKHGLTDGWVELSVFRGMARFHLALTTRHFRYDDRTRRFVDDDELIRLCGAMDGAGGRPTPDSSGRLWFSARGITQVLDPHAKAPEPRPFPLGFSPTEYVAEDNGVVWAQAGGQLARVDPRLPSPAPQPIRAIITALQFPATNRNVFELTRQLPAIAYADNSLVFRFAAPANPFASPVAFEVLLEGAGADWVSTGTVGSATFNRLKEGNYVFHVRPVTAGGRGVEARLPFLIRPPWYRSATAWLIYTVAGAGMIVFAVWFPAYLQRREKAWLETLVAKRTEELGRQIQETTAKSMALAASEERYRTLNTDLERRVQERTAQLSRSHDELQQRESLFRLIFEHAPVGISWRRSDLGEGYHFNATYQRILALPSDSAPDHSQLLRLVHPDDAALQEALNQRIIAGEIDSYSVEERFVVGAAHIVWASLSVAVVRDATGRIVQDIGILEDITARKDAESQLATTYKNLVDASRVAGMAEVATGVLHNVGNVLTSLNVSSNLLLARIRMSKAESLQKLAVLLHERSANLAEFITQDPKGRLVPELLAKLGQSAVGERDWLQQEVASMQKNIDHIKEIVAMQQSYATVVGVAESLDAATLVEDALRMNTAALSRHEVRVVREFIPTPPVTVEKGKVLQILINVIRNAKYACDDGQHYGARERLITVRVEPAGTARLRIIVRDNGVGIPAENLTRIFGHGFTTRAYGHGFGLHSSAVAAREMGGTLTAASDGPGQGATFTLELPVAAADGTRSPWRDSVAPTS